MRGDLKATTRYALVVESIFGGAEPVEVEEEDAAGAGAPVEAAPKPPAQATWVAIRLTDTAGDPVRQVKYKIELPDGSTKEGKLDDNGLAKVESAQSGMCKISFPEIDAGDWDLQRVAKAAAPAAAPKAAEKKAYFGTIKGPSGPLKSWPFLLKRGDKALDQGGLDGGSSPNIFRDGNWYSGDKGEFRFEDLPEGDYTIEVLVARGSLVAADKPKPEGVDESGNRSALPEPIDPMAFTEDPVDLLSELE